ncbi:MAG: hypothetical protein AABX88_01460, partial [Nanoarchaeota archaeon]
SESISVAFNGFGSMKEMDLKRDVFDLSWLYLGHIVKTSEGVFTNVTSTDESFLKKLLNGAEKVNGIYLLANEVGFAPHDSFEKGVQDCDTFVQGGLARALEHTSEKVALKLRELASTKFYKKGVNVLDFDLVKKPIQRVASIYTAKKNGVDDDKLFVNGGNWNIELRGYALGARHPEKINIGVSV